MLDEAIYHSVKKRSLDETLPQAPFAAQATSAATRTLPPIQGLLSWVKEKGIAFFSYANNAYVEFFIQKDYSLERKENLNSSLHLNHPKTTTLNVYHSHMEMAHLLQLMLMVEGN